MTNREFYIQQWQGELKGTLNAIKALPAEMSKLDYKPDAKSRSAIQILAHILPHANGLTEAISTGVINEKDADFENIEQAATYYAHHTGLLLDALKEVDDETWENKEVTLEAHGRKIFTNNMMTMFWFFLKDTIHHRGQLSTYYRSMGVRNPSIYGPSAEDMEERLAAAQLAASQN